MADDMGDEGDGTRALITPIRRGREVSKESKAELSKLSCIQVSPLLTRDGKDGKGGDHLVPNTKQ